MGELLSFVRERPTQQRLATNEATHPDVKLSMYAFVTAL